MQNFTEFPSLFYEDNIIIYFEGNYHDREGYVLKDVDLEYIKFCLDRGYYKINYKYKKLYDEYLRGKIIDSYGCKQYYKDGKHYCDDDWVDYRDFESILCMTHYDKSKIPNFAVFKFEREITYYNDDFYETNNYERIFDIVEEKIEYFVQNNKYKINENLKKVEDNLLDGKFYEKDGAIYFYHNEFLRYDIEIEPLKYRLWVFSRLCYREAIEEAPNEVIKKYIEENSLPPK